MSVTVECRPRLIAVHLSDVVSVHDLEEIAARFDEIDRGTPGLPRFADATGITGAHIAFDEVVQLTQDRRNRSLARDVRTAILVASDLAFGISRMYQALLDHPQVEMEVFRDRRRALAWLGVTEDDL